MIDTLNSAQKSAVTQNIDTSTLVLAGAGSGKTSVLTQRIAWLICHHHVSPSSILAVTFTNKSALELKHRLQALLTDVPIQSMWVGTFHSIAHRLLRTHYEAAGLTSNFQIIDSDDQLRLIKRLMKAAEIDEKKYSPKSIQHYINQHKQEGMRAEHVEPGNNHYVMTMHHLFTLYEQQRKQLQLVDFTEMLLLSHEIWLNRPDILEYYKKKFQFIFVDEFQDTNALQYAWLRLLVGKKGCLMAVGDDDQSIYGWRGARIENIHQFHQHFPKANVIRLEQNYRSTATILEAANAVIKNNMNRLGKTLWTEHDLGNRIQLYGAYSEIDEALFIADVIKKKKASGVVYDDMAILYRSNAQSRALEGVMLQSNIPFRIYGGQRFFERAEIKHALAYLRLIFQKNDDASFERIINFPARGLGARALEMIQMSANEHGVSFWRASELLLKERVLSSQATKNLTSFIEMITSWSQLASDSCSIEKLVKHVLVSSGLLDYYKKQNNEQGNIRLENLQELVSACKQFHEENIQSTDPAFDNLHPLEIFLAQTILDTGGFDSNEQEAVQMMTIHASKGLEFPILFLSGMEEGLFPSSFSLDEGQLDEERRLCYVGITRAKKELYLTHAIVRTLYGKQGIRRRVSRFVQEIPDDLIQKAHSNHQYKRPSKTFF